MAKAQGEIVESGSVKSELQSQKRASVKSEHTYSHRKQRKAKKGLKCIKVLGRVTARAKKRFKCVEILKFELSGVASAKNERICKYACMKI